MWIKLTPDFYLSADRLESFWYNSEKGVTLLYPLGAAAALAQGNSPTAYILLGDHTQAILGALAEGKSVLDLSHRD